MRIQCWLQSVLPLQMHSEKTRFSLEGANSGGPVHHFDDLKLRLQAFLAQGYMISSTYSRKALELSLSRHVEGRIPGPF